MLTLRQTNFYTLIFTLSENAHPNMTLGELFAQRSYEDHGLIPSVINRKLA
ncbi:MAG: hypothetical protein BMS9Abin36_1278 [Gammaproteobacteria bacterium]|nr:MAG: hypothetical protein BMS9Abin36_1278 [Gammaproteobacteria bacterium]